MELNGEPFLIDVDCAKYINRSFAQNAITG